MKSGEIKVQLDFYDDFEKAKFEQYPNASQIQTFVGKNISVDLGEFWAYMMFKDQQNYPGFRTYEELQGKIPRRYDHLSEFFNFQNGSISIYDRPKATIEVRERYGEAISTLLNKRFNILFVGKKFAKLMG